MDKQDLIDRLVDELKGIWPAHWVTVVYDVKSGLFSSWPPRRKADLLVHICTDEEFSIRAKELGWVNGYEWGVEYPTNGKKPNLPEDLEIECFDGLNWWGLPDLKVGELDFNNYVTQKFRIVDERYKPKEPEPQSKPSDGFLEAATAIKKMGDALRKSDKSWHERGEFPPAGERCLVKISGEWLETYIIGFDDDENIVFKVDYEKFKRHYDSYIKSATENFRPIKTERESLIDVIASTGNLSEGDLADAILAAGFTNNKGEIN